MTTPQQDAAPHLGATARTAPIRSIAKAVRTLKTFSTEHPELSVTELSQQLGWHKAVVHKILMTLERDRLVQKDPASRRYRLGPGIMELAGVFLNQDPLTREGTPLLKELVRATGHTAALAVLDGLMVQYVAAVEGTSGLRLVARAGDRRPAHATASGKVLLSALPPDTLDRLLPGEPLPRWTSRTIVDPARLRATLRHVRDRGFAVNIEEHIEGMLGVAAPVRDHWGAVVAAISAGFTRQPPGHEGLEGVVQQVVLTANKFSQRLGAPADTLVAVKAGTRPIPR